MATKTVSDKEYLEKIKAISLSILEKNTHKEELSDYHKRILKSIDKRQFGCQSDNVIAFASAYCGFDFQKHTNLLKYFAEGTVLKMLAKKEGYTKDALICVFYQNYAYSLASDEHHSNYILLEELGTYHRYATKEEIEEFYSQVTGRDKFLALFNENSRIKRND